MSEFAEKVWKMIVESNVLNVIWALLLLLAGWIVALIGKKLLHSVLKKLQLNRRLSLCLPDEEPGEKRLDMERLLSGILFWFLFLLTILAAMTQLNLTDAAAPIKNFLNDVIGYLPCLFAGILLLFLAWLVATGLKYIALTAMSAFRLDEKVEQHFETGGEESHLSFSIASILYWLVFLCFAPAILSALRIGGITDALQSMLNKVFVYLPNLAAAGAVAFFGLFFAGLVRKVVRKFIESMNIGILPVAKNGEPVVARKKLADLTGIAIYALIAIPVVIASLSALQIDALTNSVSGLFQKILAAAGNLFGALLLVFAAYISGKFLSGLLAQLLEGFGFDQLFVSLGFRKKESDSDVTPSGVVGKLTFCGIMLFAVIGVFEMLQFRELALLLRNFVPFLGRIIIAVIVFLTGIYLANIATSAIREKGFESALFGFALRVIILFFAGSVALHTADIGAPIVQTAFTILLGSIALATAIAFGIGGRDFAARKLDEWTTKKDENSK